jgi:glycosyltransferase involved in cell wall biosynthesis
LDLAIVIPCYNEAARFPLDCYTQFLNHEGSKNVQLVFVNDGSQDETLKVLENLKANFQNAVSLVNLKKNVGKANAVRAGVLQVLDTSKNTKKIAFLDADLATTLVECLTVSSYINQKTGFAFGSRIKKIDNNIERKLYRHLIGRVIATFISSALALSVYDTQCGCKVFSRPVAELVFKDAFLSKWLFDVEIFFRYKRKHPIEHVRATTKEIPLQEWVDKSGSKISLSYAFRVWYDLYKIKRHYSNI